MAKLPDGFHLMGNDDHGAVCCGDQFFHFLVAFFLKADIAHTEDLVDEDDVGLQNGGDGKGQLGVHTAGIGADRLVDELSKLGKFDDGGFLFLDLLLGEAQKETGEHNVFPPGQLLLEAHADTQQGDGVTVEVDGAAVGGENTSDGPEHSGFAAAVFADQADDLALFHLEADIFHRFKEFCLVSFAPQKILLDGVGFQPFVADTKVLYFDGVFTHSFVLKSDGLDIAVFFFIDLPDAGQGQQHADGKPDQQHQKIRGLAVEQALAHGRDQKCHRVIAVQGLAEAGEPGADVVKNTRQVKQEPQHDGDHIGQVLHIDAEMEQKTAAAKAENGKDHQDRQEPEDIPAQGDLQEQHHQHHDAEGDHHFEAVDPDLGQDQDEFGEIYLGNDGLVILDDLDAVGQIPVEEIPHGQADENEAGKIVFPGIKDIAENEAVDQHEAQGVQHPPDPVQVGAGYLGFQLRCGGYHRIAIIFPQVCEKMS